VRKKVKTVDKRISEIADIRTGFPFRRRIEHVADGYPLVQMGDVRADTSEIGNVQARVKVPHDPKNHFLQTGDVIFSGRGPRNEAAVFVYEAKPAIASPHLFVLRLREHCAVPAYLAWFLNHPQTQEKIRALRMRSEVPFVPMSAFSDLEVPLPNMETQQRIADVYRLTLRENELVQQIQKRRRVLADALLLAAMRRERETEISAF
jgi:hypothetical protein